MYAYRFGALRLRATSGFSLPFSRESGDVGQRFVDRAALGGAAIGSGGSELWLWAPRATSWVASGRIEQPLEIFQLGFDVQSVLMAQIPVEELRVGGTVGGDLAVRPIQELELGIRMQVAGMITEGRVLRRQFCLGDFSNCNASQPAERMLEHDRANLSVAPWISTRLFDLVTASVRFTLHLTDSLGWDVLGGTYWGVDASPGVTL